MATAVWIDVRTNFGCICFYIIRQYALVELDFILSLCFVFFDSSALLIYNFKVASQQSFLTDYTSFTGLTIIILNLESCL